MMVPFEVFINDFNARNKVQPDFFNHNPFPHAFYRKVGLNFKIIEERLSQVKYIERFTDLYNIFQSVELLKTDLGDIVSDIFPTSKSEYFTINGVYLSSQVYKFGSYLLCHDDQLEDRLFAFVIYLDSVDAQRNGGTLDFFEDNFLGEPNKIVNRIFPERGSLILFEVSPRSFHQVSEVISEDCVRRSLGGWVRGQYNFFNNTCNSSDLLTLFIYIEYTLPAEYVDIFRYTSKYTMVKAIPPEKIPIQYFFVEGLYFDENAFTFDISFDSSVEYYIYRYNPLMHHERIQGCFLFEICKNIHSIHQKNEEESFTILPGEGSFIILKCHKRKHL